MNTKQRILVVGGTGMLGAPVARQLLAAGYRVRVLSRTPDKARAQFDPAMEICAGDVADPASLQRALQDCQGVHINLKGGPSADPTGYERIEHQGAVAVVNAARAAGVARLTYLSGYTVCEKNASAPESRGKFLAENAIRASGLAYTIFRPTWFMESLPEFVQGPLALVIGRQPHPLHWAAAADYARMVARSYQLEAARYKTFYVYGPQAFSMAEALRQYCRLVAPQSRVVTIPAGLLALAGKLTFNPELTSIATLMAYYNQVGEEGDAREAHALLGAPTTTLQQWCQSLSQKPRIGLAVNASAAGDTPTLGVG